MRRPLTLRRKLVGLTSALLLVMGAALAFASALALRANLLNELDEQLLQASSRATDWAGGGRPTGFPTGGFPGQSPEGDESDPPEPGAQIPVALRAGTIVVQVNGDEVIAAGYYTDSGEYTTLTDDQTAALLTVPTDGDIHQVKVPDIGTVRAVAQTTPRSDTVVTASATASVDSAMQNFVALEALIAFAVIALAAALGTFLVRRSLKPLERVAAAATRVSRLPLDKGEVAELRGVDATDTDDRTEVGQVGAALNRLLGHVEASLVSRHASEQQVRQFVADASHELRTPLASIRGYSELITRSREEVQPQTAKAVERIHSESLRMGALVEDLLLLARLDAGRPLGHEPVDAVSVVADSVMDAHAAGPDHRWKLDLPDEPVMVIADPDRLRQVVVNLLANARVHTPAGTSVTATVRRVPTTPGGPDTQMVQIVVHDDGPGVPSDLQSTIFQRFTRADSARNRASGSTGLGLAIVHSIVTAHGGSVRLDSTPGSTTFTVQLPAAPADD